MIYDIIAQTFQNYVPLYCTRRTGLQNNRIIFYSSYIKKKISAMCWSKDHTTSTHAQRTISLFSMNGNKNQIWYLPYP